MNLVDYPMAGDKVWLHIEHGNVRISTETCKIAYVSFRSRSVIMRREEKESIITSFYRMTRIKDHKCLKWEAARDVVKKY